MVIAREVRYFMHISDISLKKMVLDLYGSHQTVTTVPASKSKHVPRLSLATQGGGDWVVRLEMIGRVGERRRRESLCAEAIIARRWRMDNIRDRWMPRGDMWREERRPMTGRCQLRDRARRATPDLRANFSRERELLRERNRERVRNSGR